MFLRFYKMKTNQIQELNQQNIRQFRIVIEKVYEDITEGRQLVVAEDYLRQPKGMILADTADTA